MATGPAEPTAGEQMEWIDSEPAHVPSIQTGAVDDFGQTRSIRDAPVR